MDRPILDTKFYVPRGRHDLIPRQRLAERLRPGFDAKLTVVSAPPGFGKTTLVAEWLESAAPDELSVAWLSLDQADGDPATFWTYVTTALDRATPTVATARAMLEKPQPAPIESVLAALVNALSAAPNEVVLVLDDYHIIGHASIHEQMAFLLDHLPAQAHVVIATRADPPLPLPRMRARGELVEIGAADLRFTHDETAAFLDGAIEPGLEASDIAALEGRTEGWIAALQLAALSMRGRDDIGAFVAGFAGDDRYVVDYLVEEVLDRQTDALRTFLLQTSILDRLNGSLCDAVTGAEGSGRTLEAMERANLFVVPLDANRRWYRYHQLFAEALEARLLDERPRVVPGLHGRASDWYERNGMPADAIRHALTARDFERAAGLTESAWPGMEESARSTTWLTWVRALPDDVVRARPVLDVAYAYALLGIGAMEDAEARLTAVERRLQSGQAVVASEEGLQVLSATIAIGRAYHAQAVGDPASTVKHAREALDLLPDGDALRRGQATALLGLTAWADGDLETADAVFADYASQLQALDDPDAISATFVLAEIRTALGRLREASATLEQSIQLATRSESIQPEAADLYRALAELHLERGALDEAEANLSRAAQLGEDTGLADWNRRLFVARARMQEALGDPDAAVVLLDEAERLSVRTPLPDVRPVSAMRARIWIRQGRLTDALDWARSRGLSTGDPPSYLREYEHLTFARALVGQHSIDETMGLLDRLLAAAEAGSRTGTVIEILVVQALAHEAQHATPRALTSLKRALELAEPEGYVRLFVDEGPRVERLLHEAAARGVAPDYARGLLAAFTQADSQPATPQLLSDREREVLQHIAEGLTNRQIADRLFLSEFTVKAHARSIYGQLEVSSRTQAVARARELGILPQG